MRRWYFVGLLGIVILVLSQPLMAEDNLAKADLLYDQGGVENIKNSIPLYVKAVEANPDSYEANWKCARAYREYADREHKQNMDGWKDLCAEYGKIGMKYGEKAIALSPDGVEGNFFYGASVGVYSDGVSILRALKEGLKGKTQTSFEKAYKVNKNYEDGAPMIALGRFWSVLPWPLKKNKRAVKYLEENLQAFPNGKHLAETQVYLGEVYLDMGKKDKAKPLLEAAAKSTDKYYMGEAKRLLSDMK